MRSPLAESLDVLLPDLVPELVAPHMAARLKGLANGLPIILRGGFECRLGADAHRVDLQQCVYPGEGDLLRERTSTSMPRGFLAEWPSRLASIPEIWLEFDLDRPTDLPLSPVVFLGLPQGVSPAMETHGVAEKGVDLLLGREWRRDRLRRYFSACPHGVFVSHIGAMSSRRGMSNPGASSESDTGPNGYLRVNVKRLRADSLPGYLRRIGWREDTEGPEASMRRLHSFVERITVCLDMGLDAAPDHAPEIHPRIGLECISGGQPPGDPHWAALLDDLVKWGLCEPKKRDLLLRWPGRVTPGNARAPWPRYLRAISHLHPRKPLSTFDRQLSHIKVIRQSTGRLEAKAYLWFEHQWS
uniref:Uncharacterized protein n=1 Tax=Candidatus Kentrum sp. LPFa TaxID=2126335 RepID=A0A450W986_9GAMM|nr:MAG: hypothetical protein BECKLPF1236B_GA0070989_104818 [Candidatus Kentron sp. LPFa]